MPYLKHLVSPARIPFTAGYFVSLGLTLYFAIGVLYSHYSLLKIVTFHNINDVFCYCADLGVVEFLRFVCSWRNSGLEIWWEDGI